MHTHHQGTHSRVTLNKVTHLKGTLHSMHLSMVLHLLINNNSNLVLVSWKDGMNLKDSIFMFICYDSVTVICMILFERDLYWYWFFVERLRRLFICYYVCVSCWFGVSCQNMISRIIIGLFDVYFVSTCI